MAAVGLRAIAKSFPGHAAIRDVDITIADGEFLVVVGPSGCGKSTLLRLIAGLEAPDKGLIEIDGIDVTSLAPQERDLAMVFQSYALYPHMTVRENLAYGLKVRGARREEIVRRVDAAARSLGLDELLERRPAQLSGGQRQRVALGRAIVRTPKAFLLDEPLSNLDPGLRTQARVELRRLHRSLGATIVYVTHDQEEAMTLGDRIAVMREGCIEQVAVPGELYSKPANAFVARFIGAPAMNFLPVSLVGVDAPRDSLAGIRPRDVIIDGLGTIRAMVDLVEPRGPDSVVHLHIDDATAASLTVVTEAPPPEVGTTVMVTFPPERLHLFRADGRRVGQP